MERIMTSFRGRIRRWREDKPGGLAVIDIPADLVAELGGRRQMRMAGKLNGVPFTGSTMLVAGGFHRCSIAGSNGSAAPGPITRAPAPDCRVAECPVLVLVLVLVLVAVRGQVLGSGPGSPPWMRRWSRSR